jgi:hypothetical protein
LKHSTVHIILGSASLLFALIALGACNPFAPELDDNPAESLPLLSDQMSVDGVFQNMRYAYTFKDTTIYGKLMDQGLTFTYRDYDKVVDVSWGRDEEMRITARLFDNAQSLSLVWNNIVSQSGDTLITNVTRSFNLTVTFNPSDIVRVDGKANLKLTRERSTLPWTILEWRDESNF